jgi:hypothetical protein
VGQVGRVRFSSFLSFIFGLGRGGSVTDLHGLGGLGRVGRVGLGWVGTGPKRVGSSTNFFQFFLPAPVPDPLVLTGHRSDWLGHRSDWLGHGSWWVRSRPRVTRVRSNPSGFF